LQNTDLINNLTNSVTNTNQAFEQAAINTDTVYGAWSRLTAQFVNYVTGSDKAKESLVGLKNAIKWVTDNLDKIIDTALTFVKWFLIIKGIVWAVRGALLAYNLAIGIAGALTGVCNTAIGKNIVSLNAYKIGLWATTDATTGLSISSTVLGRALGGLAKFGRLAAEIFLVVDAIGNLQDNWESIKKSFSSGDWSISFAKIIRSIIVALMDLTSPLNKLMGWIGKITGIKGLIDLGTDQTRPITDEQKKQYIETGQWSPAKPPPPLMTPMMWQNQHNDIQAQKSIVAQSLGSLGITLNDTGKLVQSIDTSGMSIPVKITSTQGQR
jgi:hypothetical protein